MEIPFEKMAGLGRPDPESYNLKHKGSGYFASVEVFHQLHCLVWPARFL